MKAAILSCKSLDLVEPFPFTVGPTAWATAWANQSKDGRIRGRLWPEVPDRDLETLIESSWFMSVCLEHVRKKNWFVDFLLTMQLQIYSKIQKICESFQRNQWEATIRHFQWLSIHRDQANYLIRRLIVAIIAIPKTGEDQFWRFWIQMVYKIPYVSGTFQYHLNAHT